jgi:ribosomal-protein-alanine N-acetyltransferase
MIYAAVCSVQICRRNRTRALAGSAVLNSSIEKSVGFRSLTKRNVRLRHASPNDLQQLKSLEDQVFSHDRLSRRSIAHAIRSRVQVVLLLEIPEDEIVGAAFLHYRAHSRRCRLYSIAVRNDFEEQGLGSRLLAACERDARDRGCNEMHLEVRTDNFVARRFYEQRGYTNTGLKPGYYEDGSAAFSYVKCI